MSDNGDGYGSGYGDGGGGGWKKHMKPARIGTGKINERGYQEYLQQSPYGVLEIGLKANGVDEGSCFTSYEIASKFMESLGRKLEWGKLPYPLHRDHIQEIKRMKTARPALGRALPCEDSR